MSDKDKVKQAAIDALSRPSAKKPSVAGKASKPSKASQPEKTAKTTTSKAEKSVKKTEAGISEKGSAEAESHNQAAKASTIRLSEPDKPLPQKGGAEAAVHNMAAKEAARKKAGAASGSGSQKEGGFGFLFLVLLLPLAVVGGLYAYATYTNKTAGEQAQTNSGQPNTGKATSASRSAQALRPKKSSKTAASSTPESSPALAATPVVKPAKAAPAAMKTDAHGGKDVHWDYKSTNWAKLDASFKTCGDGKSQSPINILVSKGQAGPGFTFNYRASNGKVHNNGHTVQVDLAKGNQLLVNGKAYELIQFHFHTPSENAINSRHAPMEVHLVHKNAQNQLAVVAVMIYTGGTNQLIDRMPVPAKKGDFSKSGGAYINPALLLPSDKRSHTFTGSLTTPPCTQNVGWIVLQTPIMINTATLRKFQKVLGRNNRPLQPVNGRTIFSSN